MHQPEIINTKRDKGVIEFTKRNFEAPYISPLCATKEGEAPPPSLFTRAIQDCTAFVTNDIASPEYAEALRIRCQDLIDSNAAALYAPPSTSFPDNVDIDPDDTWHFGSMRALGTRESTVYLAQNLSYGKGSVAG